MLVSARTDGQCLLHGNTWRRTGLCVVMSSTASRLLDFVVEIATTQLRNGRLPFDIHNHLSTNAARQLVGWADTTRFELPDQSRTAVHAESHIRRANAWVRRAHQFADLKLTFFSIAPEQLRFVIHTDHASKDQDGTGQTQGGYNIGATRQWKRDTWRRGARRHWSVRPKL